MKLSAFHCDMFSITCTQAMWKVPFSFKLFANFYPIICVCLVVLSMFLVTSPN